MNLKMLLPIALAGCTAVAQPKEKHDTFWAHYDGKTAEFYACDVFPLGDHAEEAETVYNSFMLSLFSKYLSGNVSAKPMLLSSKGIFGIYRDACDGKIAGGDIDIRSVSDELKTEFSRKPEKEVEVRIKWTFEK